MTLLDREVADPDQPLEGTNWVLDGLIFGSIPEATVSSVPVGVRGALRLEGDQVTLDTGCNTGGATATVEDGMLTIGPLALTRRGCEGDAATVETTMASVLRQGGLQVQIQARRLNLIGPDGGLMFLAE